MTEKNTKKLPKIIYEPVLELTEKEAEKLFRQLIEILIKSCLKDLCEKNL